MRLGIAGRLAVVLAALAIVASSITGWMVYRTSRDLLTEAAQARLLTTTQVLARRLAGVLESAMQDAARIADNSELRAALHQPTTRQAQAHFNDLAEQLEAVLRANPEYYQIRLITEADDGLERLRIERDPEGRIRRFPEIDLQEKGHLPYVFEALRLPPGEVYVSSITINHEAGQWAGSATPTMRIVAPVRDATGAPHGLIVISLSLDGIFSVLGEDLPRDHELYLANGRGEFLIHPDPQQRFAFDRGRSARVQDQFPETARLFTGQERTLITLQDAHGGAARAVVAAFVRASSKLLGERRFLVIGLAQPLDTVLNSTQRLATVALGTITLCALLALILAAVIGRALTAPLRSMAAAVKVFQTQHVDGAELLPLPLARSDEIGALARGLDAMQSDIAGKMRELNAQRNELAHQARHDPLTGLPNRLLFADRIAQALARARRSGQPVALLFIDLDKFKPINDTHGHAAGDAMLVSVAQRLRAAVRAVDTAARIGGDEFVVLMEGTDDNDYLEIIGKKLIETLTVPLVWQGQVLLVGASIGIACFPRDGDSVDVLSSRADAGMYRAKLHGGSSVVFASGMTG